MLTTVVSSMRIIVAGTLLAINSVGHILPLLVVAVIKLVMPIAAIRRHCDRVLAGLAASWIGVNSWCFDRLTDTAVVVDELPDADLSGQMLVVCNHQSWVDIPVLQKLFNRRLPLLRFFLKSQLIWVPLLGLAWWALDFPFMKRYTRAQIARKPQLAGRDIRATRKACRKFRHLPVAIVNFVEGTRFTPAKHADQDSQYRHLLKPRAGGVAFTLDAMGEGFDTLVDVTIAYPGGAPSLADLFANRIPEIRVHAERHPIPRDLRGGDYENDPDFRRRIQDWVNTLWATKDEQLDRMLAERE